MTANINGDCAYNVAIFVMMLWAHFRSDDAHALLVSTGFLLYSVILVTPPACDDVVSRGTGHRLAGRVCRFDNLGQRQRQVHADQQVLPGHGDAGSVHQGAACILPWHHISPVTPALGPVRGLQGVQAPRRRPHRATCVPTCIAIQSCLFVSLVFHSSAWRRCWLLCGAVAGCLPARAGVVTARDVCLITWVQGDGSGQAYQQSYQQAYQAPPTYAPQHQEDKPAADVRLAMLPCSLSLTAPIECCALLGSGDS